MKKTLLMTLVALGVLIFAAEANLTARKRDYASSLVSNPFDTRLAYHYLVLRRQFIQARNAEYSMAAAFHIARQPADGYTSQMRNGGLALSLLVPVSASSDRVDEPFVTQAAYEALVLLSRMPADADLIPVADQAAKTLFSSLKAGEKTGDPAEVFQIKEVLSMYAARKRGDAEIVEGALNLPGENQIWRNDLATVRIGLSACAHRDVVVPDASREALARGFGLKWLGAEAKMGWDAALTSTVAAASSSAECKRFASRYESMIDLANGKQPTGNLSP
jgi:hypothetical protein